jgi:lipopolysaccharide transport system ATP-binding protein
VNRPIIEVRGLSKSYRLGGIGFTSLRDEVQRAWARFAWRSAPAGRAEFWALREVSFDVLPGEVLGLIGRNGAGKSTLLKILGEITAPTAGEVRLRGHVASLLEVGTGFHPELSGRENIFLNGAILGMRRAEIARKFDEIVAFAEIERFLDTPVKRYSSGMYVRLAFAVAAHLEPEILLVDEVLAVGDHAFQQKCLGKMQDVARAQGRTVIFVSHNLAAVSRLCSRALLLEDGTATALGPASEVVGRYLAQAGSVQAAWARPADHPHTARVQLEAATVLDAAGRAAGVLPHSSPITLVFECRELETLEPWLLRVSIADRHGHELLCTRDTEATAPRRSRAGTRSRARCLIPAGLLKPGVYSVSVTIHEHLAGALLKVYEAHDPLLSFEVSEQDYAGQEPRGLVNAGAQWRIESA